MELELKKRAVIYCRVSTKEQVEEGNSLSTQEKNCQEYAQKNGYEIAAIFVEQGESAKTADRTELKKLLSYCADKKNNINAVISYKIDRISRNTDDYSQIRILLKRYGVEIKSTSEHFENTPAGRFMENIIANVAQFDNDVRAERSVGGMREAVREGRYVWMAPYGYSNIRVNGKSTIEPNHFAPWVRKVFNEIALGKDRPEEIRKKLIRKGLVNKRGNPISKSLFYRIIKNEIYAGWVEMFNERHKGMFKPLISEQLFQQVQHILSRKNGFRKHYDTTNPDFPLRKFYYHPSGKAFTGCWVKGSRKKYAYYMVHKRKINIRKETLEATFKNFLNKFKMDVSLFEKLKSYVKRHLNNGLENKKLDKEKLEKKAFELKAKQAILIEKNIEGIISNDLCRDRLSAIDNELFKINKAIVSLPTIKMDFNKVLPLIRDILLNPAKAWERAGFAQKIKLQWFHFPNGIEYDGLESRTTKICKLLKLKDQFPPLQFPVVNHPKPKLNTSNLQISLPYDDNGIESELFWPGLLEEIENLAGIVNSTD